MNHEAAVALTRFATPSVVIPVELAMRFGVAADHRGAQVLPLAEYLITSWPLGLRPDKPQLEAACESYIDIAAQSVPGYAQFPLPDHHYELLLGFCSSWARFWPNPLTCDIVFALIVSRFVAELTVR